MSAVWYGENVVRVRDLKTRKAVLDIRLDDRPVATALSPDGSRLTIGLSEPSVVMIDLASGREVHRLGGFDLGLARLAWSPDGRWIAATGDYDARVWDATTGSLRAALRGHTSFAAGIDWSSDSTRIATGSEDGTARVWEITDDGAREVLTLSAAGTLTSVAGVAFSPDAHRLLAGDETIRAVTIFDVDLTGSSEWSNVPAPGPTGVDFSPDGKRLVASGDSGSATIWDPDTGRSLGATGTHGSPNDPATDAHVSHVDVSPEGALIATATKSSVKAWDAQTGANVFSFARGGTVKDIHWSSDGSMLAVAGASDGVTTILDRMGKTVGQVHEAQGFYSVSAVFSPDGALLATGRDVASEAARLGEVGVTIWDWRTGEVGDDVRHICE